MSERAEEMIWVASEAPRWDEESVLLLREILREVCDLNDYIAHRSRL